MFEAKNRRGGAALALLTLGLTLGAAAPGHAAPAARAYLGKPVAIGHGTGRVLVRVDRAGKPSAIGVVLSRAALNGLPSTPNPRNSDGQWEYALPLPARVARTGYRAVVIDWNPHGHPPPHIYTAPHFDFHFYVMPARAISKVAFSGPADPAARVTTAALVAPGYRVVPQAAVNKMGVHAMDLGAPEFHGKPFTATFIYGYYKNRLTFVEPMVTRAFLLSRPSFAAPVPVPAQYSSPAYYPSRYGVRYDAARNGYVVELDALRRWAGPPKKP